MSGKKNKKRQHKKVTQVSANSGVQLTAEKTTKKFKPLARNILLLDLVVLAVVQILMGNGTITEETGNTLALAGLVGIMLALYIQFTDNNEGGNTLKSPKN